MASGKRISLGVSKEAIMTVRWIIRGGLKVLTRKMVIYTAMRSPISLTEVPQVVLREFAGFLNICYDARNYAKKK